MVREYSEALAVHTTRRSLMDLLRDIGSGRLVYNPDHKSNLGSALHRIFIWQEIAAAAETELKLAWAAAQGKDGICDVDDVLRKNDVGTTEVCNSKSYAMTVEVKTPAQRLDQGEFYKALAKRFKTTVDEIEAIAERCKVDNKPALTKRVVERV